MTERQETRPRHDDGLPTLPTGEPVLARWFVIAMLILVPIGLGVTAWAFLSIGRDPIPVAARRPPGTAVVTHLRGEATLNQTAETEPGPACAEDVSVFGDSGARAAARRALGATCQLLQTGDYPAAEEGLRRWEAGEGVLRFAVFELTGVDSSARLEDGRAVIELNPRLQFEDATRAAPYILHELDHLGSETWPGAPVTAADELRAMQTQAAACEELIFRDQPPRGCEDADKLLELDDPLGALTDAGYPD